VRTLALVGCEQCGIVFTHPLPTDAQLDAYYATPDGWQQRVAKEGGVQQNEVKIERRAAEWEVISPVLPAPDASQGRPRVLDFGCGIGAYLDVLKERGWETFGLEPGPPARDFTAERHTVIDIVPEEPTFDLVIAYHVFEHLRDPLGELRRLQRSLRPGGHLLLSVPDLGALGRHEKFSYVSSGVHIFSYTRASLTELFARAGLEKVRDSYDPAWQVLREENETRLRFLGRKAEGDVTTVNDAPLEDALAALRVYGDSQEALKQERREAPKEPRPVTPPRAGRSQPRRLLARLRRLGR